MLQLYIISNLRVWDHFSYDLGNHSVSELDIPTEPITAPKIASIGRATEPIVADILCIALFVVPCVTLALLCYEGNISGQIWPVDEIEETFPLNLIGTIVKLSPLYNIHIPEGCCDSLFPRTRYFLNSIFFA